MDEKLRILLCEDDENLGMLLREYLQAKGYSTELCPDGEAGYKAFLKNKYDLCVLDVMMPKKDGFTLAQEIRQANAEIPIIFLTAKTLKEDILEGFKIGADDYITKPFSMEELTFRIEAILRRVRGKRNKESNMYKIGRFTFDTQKQILSIGDKQTKLTTKESELLGLLCARSVAGGNAIGKFVLIGDHKQLPAVVLQASEHSEVCDESLRAIGIRNLKDSLFERLYRSACPRACDMLQRQGRMNEEVARFPSEAFYGGLLKPVGLPHQYGQLSLADGLQGCEWADLLTRRVAFIPSVPELPMQSAKINRSEAHIAACLAAAIYRQYAAQSDFNPSSTLGIITPYRSQIALIKKELENQGIPALSEILVDTVERFQGSERDVIIYSFCVNRAYQLKFLANMTEENGVAIDRKLNVALTRARKQMFVTGVPELLRQNAIYNRLLQAIDN